MKKIKIYTLSSLSAPDTILTLSAKKKDIYEYIDTLLQLNHFEHFKLWCELRNFDFKDRQAWFLYVQDCIPEDEKNSFLLKTTYYNITDIVAFLRIFFDKIPLGTSQDKLEECLYVKESLTQYSPEIQKIINSACELNKESLLNLTLNSDLFDIKEKEKDDFVE